MSEIINEYRYESPTARFSFETIGEPRFSEWQCHLFGGAPGHGLVWRPLKDKEPNWFWRKMQYLAFGNRWIKDDYSTVEK